MTTHEDGGLFDVSASHGWKIGRGALFGTVEFRDRGETNRAGADPRDQIVAGDAGNNSVAQPNFHWGDADTTDLMSFFNGEFPITDGHDVHVCLRWTEPRAWDRTAGSSVARCRTRTGRRSIPQGYLPLIEPDIVDWSAHRRRARNQERVVLGRQRAVRLQQLRFQRQRTA